MLQYQKGVVLAMDANFKSSILQLIVATIMPLACMALVGAQGFSSEAWRIEKYTINLHSATGLNVHNWISKFLCTPKGDVPSDLGCGNLRVWCQIASPYDAVEWPGHVFELHWVDAPSLNDFHNSVGKHETDTWIEYFDELLGERLDFSAFSHNKVQLYVQNLAPYLARFDAGNVTHFKRSSLDKYGSQVAHVGFSLAGRIFELVGAAVNDSGSWAHWSEDECATSHVLEESLSFYADAVKAAYPSTLGHGFGEMLVVGISISFHDPLARMHAASEKSISTLYKHLSTLAGAKVEKHPVVSETCVMSEIRFDSMPGLVTRYVSNDSPNLQPLRKSVLDFDNYAASLHAHYSRARSTAYHGNWYGWDHMLDQHLGLWYGGDRENCLHRSSVCRAFLHESQLGVGERGEPDAHEMYVGYAGPMAWQYQWQDCNAGRPAAPSECACIASNNLDDYMTASNETGCMKHHRTQVRQAFV